MTEKSSAGIRYSVQPFYPPDKGAMQIESIDLPNAATNLRIIGVKATQSSGMTLDTGYGWPKDVDASVNTQFKPETWVDLAKFTVGPRAKGRVQLFVGIERLDPNLPAVLPGVEMKYKVDNNSYSITSVAYALIDSTQACADENWRKRLPAV